MYVAITLRWITQDLAHSFMSKNLKQSFVLGIAFTDGDYDGERIVLTVHAGVLSQFFVVNVTDDNIVEYNEVFSVSIQSVSTCGVTIGIVNTSDVIITNNDSEL